MNTGVPYELAVKSILQEILDQDSVQTITVQHNVEMKGRTTTHQIDLLWRFSVGGIIYTTIVQAKDWASKIKKETVLAFRGVLEDLPGQPRGLIITRTGFQAGAKALAEKHGIQLFVIRHASPKVTLTDISYATFSIDTREWVLRATVYRPVVRTSFLFVDPSTAPRALTTGAYFPRKVHLVNSAGVSGGTLRDVLAAFVQEMRSTGRLSAVFTRRFEQPTFVRLSGSKRLHRFATLRAEIDIVVEPELSVPFGRPGIVEFILEDLQSGTKRHYRIGARLKQGPS